MDYVPLSVDFSALQKDSDGLQQPLRFSCEGRLYREEDKAVLLYQDPGDLGFSKTANRIELLADGRVKLIRSGDISMTLLLQEGEKNVTTLGVEGGQLAISLYAPTVYHQIEADQGSVDLVYVLDYGNSYTIENTIHIAFKPTREIDLPDLFDHEH